jgi:hypothetical protein
MKLKTEQSDIFVVSPPDLPALLLRNRIKRSLVVNSLFPFSMNLEFNKTKIVFKFCSVIGMVRTTGSHSQELTESILRERFFSEKSLFGEK